MSWSFSRVLVEEYLVVFSSGIDVSAQLNTTHMPEAYYWPDKTTEHSRLSRFGMTCEPLMENHGGELLMWYLAGFHAKTLVAQEKEQELLESEADYGQRWRASLAKYDPDTHSLKTAQCSLIEDLTWCCATLPRWGSMRNGGLYQRQMLEQTMKGKEFGLLLATPTATSNQDHPSMMKHPSCVEFIRNMYPTSTAHNAKEGNYPAEKNRKTPLLATHVGGKIHPHFTEWMMGWPQGWTDLKPLGMDKFLEWQQQHSLNYSGD